MALVLLAPLVVLPWLQGFSPTSAADHPSRDVAAEISEWRAPDESCVASRYGGLAVDDGDHRVIASYTQGVFVLGPDRHLLGRATGFDCKGSADAIVGLAVGDAWIGAPVIALGATTGGRNENITWITLYQLDGEQLRPIFTGTVEKHVGHETRTGTVITVPGGLIYREPTGITSLWTYDAAEKRYVERTMFMPNT